MSGRGLGFTGGTIDKLEAIPGYKTDITVEEFNKKMNEHKMNLKAMFEESKKLEDEIIGNFDKLIFVK